MDVETLKIKEALAFGK